MVAYAAGFATGNYVEIILEERISIGYILLRIVIKEDPRKLAHELRKENYHFTIIEGKSGYEKRNVKMLFSVIPRKRLKKAMNLVRKINSNAFFTIEDVRKARKNPQNISTENRNLTLKKAK